MSQLLCGSSSSEPGTLLLCVHKPGVGAELKMPILRTPLGVTAGPPSRHLPCRPSWHSEPRAGISGSLQWLTSLITCPLPCGFTKVPICSDTEDISESPRTFSRGRSHSLISVLAPVPARQAVGRGDRRGIGPPFMTVSSS